MNIVRLDNSTGYPMFVHENGGVTPASDIAIELYEEVKKCYSEIDDKNFIIQDLFNKNKDRSEF